MKTTGEVVRGGSRTSGTASGRTGVRYLAAAWVCGRRSASRAVGIASVAERSGGWKRLRCSRRRVVGASVPSSEIVRRRASHRPNRRRRRKKSHCGSKGPQVRELQAAQASKGMSKGADDERTRRFVGGRKRSKMDVQGEESRRVGEGARGRQGDVLISKVLGPEAGEGAGGRESPGTGGRSGLGVGAGVPIKRGPRPGAPCSRCAGWRSLSRHPPSNRVVPHKTGSSAGGEGRPLVPEPAHRRQMRVFRWEGWGPWRGIGLAKQVPASYLHSLAPSMGLPLLSPPRAFYKSSMFPKTPERRVPAL